MRGGGENLLWHQCNEECILGEGVWMWCVFVCVCVCVCVGGGGPSTRLTKVYAW